MIRVEVPVGSLPYEVVVGRGARHELAAAVAATAPGARACALVTQQSVIDAGWLEGLDSGLEQSLVVIPEGEDHKSLATIEAICRQLVERGISRRDLVVAVGGGLVSDVTGFVAASYLRGIGYLTIATTLLAQVDAAIGGKTGVNLPEGKNLVGAFWQPLRVLCDTEVLATLPPAERACGRGEMAKYAFLDGTEPTTEMLGWTVDEQVARCVEIKAAIVAADERESGLRMLLNYGHTLAHALEAIGLERRAAGESGRVTELRHGEAVAVGIFFAALLAQRLGRIGEERVALHRQILGGFDLDIRLPEGLSASALVDAMARDKKAHHDLTFVLDGARGLEPVEGVDPALVARYADRDGSPQMSQPNGEVLLVSGPNLDLLGEREPAVYGTETLAEHVGTAQRAAARHGLGLHHVQSNHEGRSHRGDPRSARLLRGDRDQRRSTQPHLLGHPRRARRPSRGWSSSSTSRTRRLESPSATSR